jgi:D-threo-aldose 1-dehydrogenase
MVRAVGAGMNSPAPLAWLVERCDLDCVLVAGRYTLLDDSAAASLFLLCQRRGVAVLAGGVFNSGILAGPRDDATYDFAPAPSGLLAERAGCAAPAAATASRFPRRRSSSPCATRRDGCGSRRAQRGGDHGRHLYLSTPIPDALWAELEALLHDREDL